MAEIKRTIDLVMEKTRNLTMTEEERHAARTGEWTGKARGWVQKYLDNAIDVPTLKEYLKAGEKEVPDLRGIVKGALLDSLKLDDDNRKIFTLFHELLGISIDPINKLVATFLGEIEQERKKRSERVHRALAARGISGSAVVPNVAVDSSWDVYVKAVEGRFQDAVRALLPA